MRGGTADTWPLHVASDTSQPVTRTLCLGLLAFGVRSHAGAVKCSMLLGPSVCGHQWSSDLIVQWTVLHCQMGPRGYVGKAPLLSETCLVARQSKEPSLTIICDMRTRLQCCRVNVDIMLCERWAWHPSTRR